MITHLIQTLDTELLLTPFLTHYVLPFVRSDTLMPFITVIRFNYGLWLYGVLYALCSNCRPCRSRIL
jgi:hypothetical protein